MHVLEKSWCMLRLQMEELTRQLEDLREVSEIQHAKVKEAAEATAQQKEDATWVQQMTSEIQALGARITSLLRELLVSSSSIVSKGGKTCFLLTKIAD